MTFGQTPIDQVKIDMRARDKIPKLLLGLQHIFCDKGLHEKVFAILETMVPENVDSKNDRPGMELWKILAMGTIRLNCNRDYDKLQDIGNNHRNIRQMQGHGLMDNYQTYPLQTLKNNVKLLTPKIIDIINTLGVLKGHKLLVKKRADITAVEIAKFKKNSSCFYRYYTIKTNANNTVYGYVFYSKNEKHI